jgi:hypothetical protein
MKFAFKNFQLGLLFIAFLLVVGCDNNDEIKVDPTKDYDVELTVAQGGATTPDAPVTVNASTQSTVSAKVTFTSTDKSMKRLYITQNINGQGETIYKPTESVDLKADGAVDLTGKNANNFDYAFELPVPSGISTGTVVYKFWTTTGNGDPRDLTQRLAVGPGTITLNYGGNNPAAGTAKVKSFTDVKLAAPLADGSSSTFLSLLDGKVYKINQGEEYVTYWDFGYYYLTSGAKASLASTAGYNPLVVNIPDKAKTTEELNKVYFASSAKTTAQFDAITTSADLDFIVAGANQSITDLTAGEVVEFVNQYGKKGLIKVLEVSGTDGSNGYIRIAVKVQP